MDTHFVGQGQFSGEDSSSPIHETTSLAVRQFMELVRGEREVRRAQNPFRTVSLTAEERYCMGCFDVRWHDVWDGCGYWGMRCRVCGKEG